MNFNFVSNNTFIILVNIILTIILNDFFCQPSALILHGVSHNTPPPPIMASPCPDTNIRRDIFPCYPLLLCWLKELDRKRSLKAYKYIFFANPFQQYLCTSSRITILLIFLIILHPMKAVCNRYAITVKLVFLYSLLWLELIEFHSIRGTTFQSWVGHHQGWTQPASEGQFLASSYF